MVYSIANLLFIDDASGAQSKQWNLHYNAYSSNGCLPRALIDKQCNVEFVATSPHAAPLEILQGILADMQ